MNNILKDQSTKSASYASHNALLVARRAIWAKKTHIKSLVVG